MELFEKKEEPEKEEQIVNVEKLYDLLSFYKTPLIFTLLGLFFLAGAIWFWQSNNETAKITFTREASESGRIKIDIEGAVMRPGLYELSFGSRINDLLIMAGGLSVTADRDWLKKNINLAQKLIDGGKIYILSSDEVRSGKLEAGSEGAKAGASGVSLTVNLNEASLSELETLPGIGPVTAQKIIDGRPYQTLEELVSKKAVGQSVFEKIKDKISL